MTTHTALPPVDAVADLLDGLPQRHRLTVLFLGLGHRPSDVARELGYRKETVSRIGAQYRDRIATLGRLQAARLLEQRNQLFLGALLELRDREVLSTLARVLTGENAAAAARAVEIVLQRTGFPATAELNQHTETLIAYTMTPDVRDVLAAVRTGAVRMLREGPPPDEIEPEAPDVAVVVAGFGSV
jgi:hypothetical protein